MKRKIGIRTVGLLLLLLAAAGLAGLWWANTRTETVYVAAADIPRYAQVTAEDVLKVEIATRRAAEIAVLGASPVGQWATIHIPAHSLLGPAMFTATPPDRRVLGEVLLPVGWRGYVLVVPTPLTRELVPGDLVDLVLVEESGTEGLLLFQKVPLLKLEQQETQAVATLALQVEQAVILDAYLTVEQEEKEDNVYPLLLLSQDANPDLPALTRYDLRHLVPELFDPIGPAEGQAWEAEQSSDGERPAGP